MTSRRAVSLFLILAGSWFSLRAQCNLEFSAPVALNADSESDAQDDSAPHLAFGDGAWIAVWTSPKTSQADLDVIFARSVDGGSTWSSPATLAADADTDGTADYDPRIATDGAGRWIAIWSVRFADRIEVRIARSIDGARTWTASAALGTGSELGRADLATDRSGVWIAFWRARDKQSMVFARSTDSGATWAAPALVAADALPTAFADPGVGIAAAGQGTWIATWSSYSGATQRLAVSSSRSVDAGASWLPPVSLSGANFVEYHVGSRVATDRTAKWMTTWTASNSGNAGPPPIKYTRSESDGHSWYPPAELSEPSVGNVSHDSADIAMDADGDAISVWRRRGTVSDANPNIYFTSTRNVGWIWTTPVAISGADAAADNAPVIATDGAGGWISVWTKTRGDADLFFARARCADQPVAYPYGTPLFEPICTGASVAPASFAERVLAVRRGVNDSFYLSRRGDAFTPLALADTLRIDGVDTGIGPATNQPGVPPYRYHTPVDCNLQPVPALDVTGFLPLGTGAHTFTLEDTAGGIFGTTSLYLVRDCGIWLEQSPGAVTLRFLSHRVDVDGQPASLDVVTGRLSELKADGGFARACSAGHFSQTGVVLSRPDPPAGEADYYLASGTCHKPIGFGDSSLVPDPRAALGSAPACP